MIYDTPVIAIDLDKLELNLKDMSEFCIARGIRLRPHIKAHKSVEIALRQLELGAQGITTAKLGEAEVMAAAGIEDIFIANQLTGWAKLQRLAVLAKRIKVSVGIDSIENAWELNQMALNIGIILDVMLEIDSGLHRCGIEPGKQVLQVAQQVATCSNLQLKGIFTHAGHAYAATFPEAVREIGLAEGRIMVEQAVRLAREDIHVEVVSVGSTPTAKYAGLVPGVTELRPGNYVFNDAIQVALGTASQDMCALTVLATVISRPSRDRAVIDAGSKTLNMDMGAHGNCSVQDFGLVTGRPGIKLNRLSEEHGVLSLDPDEELQVGDVVEIIPNHACTVINLFDTALTMRRGQIVGEVDITARGMVR